MLTRNSQDCFDCSQGTKFSSASRAAPEKPGILSPPRLVGKLVCRKHGWLGHWYELSDHTKSSTEIHNYPAFNHSLSLSTDHAETSCNSKEVPNIAGRACTISVSSWGLVRGWCCAWVLPAWLTPVGSVSMPGFTGSAAAAAHGHCCAHLWSAEHKIPIAIEAGSNISFSKTQVLATVLKYRAEYFPVRVCAFCYLQYLLRSIKAKCLCQCCLFVFDNCWCHCTFVCKWKPVCCWVIEGKTQ